MRSLGRLVFGFRPDLNLSEHWWHRLFKVLFVLGLILIAGFVLLAQNSESRLPAVKDVTIITNLRALTYNSSVELGNIIPVFLDQTEGEVAALEGELKSVSEFSLRRGFCSADLAAYPDGVAKVLNDIDPSNRATAADAREFIQTERTRLKPNEERRVCIYKVGFMSDTIVKYRWTWRAHTKKWARITGTTLALVAVFWILAANIYYRGLVYVVFGKRKTEGEPAAV